ncbi:hypothetical protein E4P40_02540 [Blastococcus sp. CT_GayMR20]|uniref:hypothetical protein n=1 Tax=Blastococcus sp. CT_GayMR20 TaxID=2559609 RepID=UPI0010740E02|nr:hypothetical protein [Blastococcus sp. CT_GayMR20]TFV92578.1 hypothetical protein E4P40_02205 [Blastococcus sp. CT_GayMR20]TFV92635.1 hypothetical protein E4P40_02540 [Blastococcus sp. CT_GayMR20]
MTVGFASWDDPEVQRLAADQQAEVRARYDGKGNQARRRPPPTSASSWWRATRTGRRSAAAPCASWGRVSRR